VGLKLNYQFDEEPIDTYISSKHKNSEDNELPAKKLKLNDKKIAILEYSSVQLPLTQMKQPTSVSSDYFRIHKECNVEPLMKYFH